MMDATMKTLLFTPVVLSLVVLAAHFSRADNGIAVIASFALIGILFVRRAWVPRLIQVALGLATIEWIRTVYVLVEARIAAGEPYLRLGIILGIVVIVTAGSAFVFETRTMRRIYSLR